MNPITSECKKAPPHMMCGGAFAFRVCIYVAWSISSKFAVAVLTAFLG